MKVQVQKLEALKRVIIVDIEISEFKEDRDASYKEIGKTIKVSGFRPGTAPLDILEKNHGEYLKEKFLEKALPLFYTKSLEQENLVPASMPRIFDVVYDKEHLKFSAEFEIKPVVDIKDSDYKGVKISEKIPDVKEEEVEKVITNINENIKKTIAKDITNEELAHWAGYSTIDALRSAIKTELLTQKLHDRTRKLNQQISQHLLKQVKFEIPRAEVERHHKELIEREVYTLQQRGISEPDIEKYKKDIEEKLKPVSEDDVRLFYILETIARKENLKIDNNLGEMVLGLLLSQSHY
jgi:FKBP-type peptidyl-prolyl cis-trans isomerase (trigger factor)